MMFQKFTKFFALFFGSLLLVGMLGYVIQEYQGIRSMGLQAGVPPANFVQIPNSQREQFYLNGVWQFMPATDHQTPPTQGWGTIQVPGNWQTEKNISVPGIVERGVGPDWENFEAKTLARAWYQREIEIPKTWTGRKVLVSLERVSTDAQVFVNGVRCGTVNWPYGAVDITSQVQPGTKATLSILVVAVPDEKDTEVVMDADDVYTTEAKLNSSGLIGEVRLYSQPAGAFVSDVFIQPSTRHQELKLDIELTDVQQTGPVNLTAQLFNEQGEVEKEFQSQTTVKSQTTQTLQVAWQWTNPRLWDIGKPNLYVLRLQVEGAGVKDEYDQPFGFREFWIEGRKFYLNGKEVRWRPIRHTEPWPSSIPAVTDRTIDGYFWAGFNITELWPWNHDLRGTTHFRELFVERADVKGFPVMGPALDGKPYFWRWYRPTGKSAWEPRMIADLRRYRNHPSILMWATSANYFGHRSDDQNPRRIGIKEVKGTLGEVWDERFRQRRPIGEDLVTTIKKYDPTRPVLVHNGGVIGDVYALNTYLNMIPLQEREEWLSEWSQKGEMPYMVMEFGTPLHNSMMRNRVNFHKSIISEPLMTEFTAIYFGKEVYRLETPEYRQKISQLWIQDQDYKSWQHENSFNFAPAFQKLQELFSTNTWRSWRTYGITGGMIPWSDGHGWEVSEQGREMISMEPDSPQRRGPYLPEVRKFLWYKFQPEGYTIHPGGRAILANNAATLAWIAGQSPTLAAKDHHFTSGQTLDKQIALLNDTQETQPFSYQWSITINGKQIAQGEKSGTLESPQTLLFPISTQLPDVTGKAAGQIQLTAKVGERTHRDQFNFRVFGSPSVPSPRLSRLLVFDPVGKTTRMLQQLGYNPIPWSGSETPQQGSLLVIGREALSQGYSLPGNLETWVKTGGQAIVFTQNPQWTHGLGWRVSPHLSRRVFPVADNHPVVAGLDSEDLRDWRTESTLVEAYPNTIYTGTKLSPPRHLPWYGWHWGNRGSVSSVPIEKPHRSSWRPILESEFDLAYTPLMELDYGQGRLIWCSLDLEDQIPLDPAAMQVAYQLISYSLTPPASVKANQVILVGSDRDAQTLDELGVIYQRREQLVPEAELTIVGPYAAINSDTLKAYIEQGGKVFFLPGQNADTLVQELGVRLRQVKDFAGSLQVPEWPEARGLSLSDLHVRSGYETWLIGAGGEIAADGLLSRLQLGKGVAIICQIDPQSLNADEKTYLRYTRWRQTRATAQILANLGATFKADQLLFTNLAQKTTALELWVPVVNEFYHPDYRTDFELGDDPYRYSLW